MKQETYNKLKLAWKFYEYTMYALVFTIGLIALIFGAVYLGRKACEPNIQEVSKHELKPRLANSESIYGYYQGRDLSYYDTSDFSDFIGESISTGSDAYTFIYADIQYRDFTYEGIYFNTTYYAGSYAEGYYIISCYLFYNNSSSSQGFLKAFPQNYENATTDFSYVYFGVGNSTDILTIKNPYSNSDINVTEVLDNFFLPVWTSYSSIEFLFSSDYNFAPLTSEVVTSERLIIPFNNQFNGNPSDEFVEFYIKADFVSNNVFYRGILFVLNKPIYLYKDGLKTVNFQGSLSQLMINQVYYMKSLPAHMPYENYPLEFSISNDCDLVANKHIVRYESYNDGQTDRQVPVYDYKQYDWVNQTYRLVYFSDLSYNSTYHPVFYPTDNTMWSNRLYLGLTLYQVLNNGYYDYNYTTNTYALGDSNDLSQAFTLLAGAFGGLTSLMYIQVLPGISLGLLFFVPLIVTIIIVVLRLVKK